MRRRGWSAVILSVMLVASLPMGGGVSLAADPPILVRTIGGPARAQIYPGGIDVDAAGNVYVADTGNDQVVRLAAGTSNEDWRSGVRGAGLGHGYSDVRDVAVTTTGDVYVAVTGLGAVVVLDAATGAYERRLAFGGFRTPIGVSVGVDASGDEVVLVSNGRSGNVDVFSLSGQHTLTIPPRLGANAGTRDAATDLQGRIYVADYRHDAIQVYTAGGVWLSSWGGASAPTCQKIPRPYGVDVDDAGIVYVASSNANRIHAFQADGTCVRTYGSWGSTADRFSQLRRVAVTPGPSPEIFGADLWGIKVLVYDKGSGVVDRRLGSWPHPSAGGFNEVRKVGVTTTHVYGSDTNNHRGQGFNLDGTLPFSFGKKGPTVNSADFDWPFGLGVNGVNDHVWVANTHDSNLKEFLPDGTWVRTLGKLGSQPGQFNWPQDVAFDGAGNMYVADASNNRIQSFTPSLAFRWSYGTAGSGLSNLRRPAGLTYDPVGNRILVADTSNSRIVALSPATGARLAILPITRGTAPGQIMGPEDVAVDAAGHIWVADTQNNRIQRFEANGSYSQIVLGGLAISSGPGGFAKPSGIEVGPDGLLYVADTYNDRIQVFQP